jgi:hypothetical protein
MTASELIAEIQEVEPEEAICQNPLCNESFASEGSDFCSGCDEHLSACEKWNIRYAIENGLESRHVLGHIMNGGTWNR